MTGAMQPFSRGFMGLQILLLLMPLTLLYLTASFFILSAITQTRSAETAMVGLVMALCAPCLFSAWQLSAAFLSGGRLALLRARPRAWRWASLGVTLTITATALSQLDPLQSFLVRSQLGEISLLQFGLPLLLPWLHVAIEKRLAMRDLSSQ